MRKKHGYFCDFEKTKNAQRLLEKLGFRIQDNKGSILYYKLDLSSFAEYKPEINVLDKITLENYKLTISKSFEAIEFIEKSLLLNGNHEILRNNIVKVILFKQLILSDFEYDIHQISES